ncbi:rod-binding protein [Mesorhizobium sp. LNJC395A00]|uniref:rod-binding protein n=1 Tax=Mesorhizobium sp. LNJC395A00 TaxID=1287275 RepID=UPI0003CF0BEC|nr:rod-binding protein [Mesorhizobium sp. LNJC395A00]ESY21858.1 flagellar protein FlgJ [Mesorhizobium sp. LNJC395A00]
MAISPPSDIVLDVARAVDPTDIEAARAALAKRANGVGGAFLVDMAASVDTGSILSRATADKAAAGADPAGKFKKFEAMVLQTFIQNMLPKDTEGVYGKGLAGDMWKSQLAERVADVMAERGGIGIAKSLLADHYKDGKRTGPHKTEIDQQTRLSTSLVEELQRKAARSMTGDETTIKTEIKI